MVIYVFWRSWKPNLVNPLRQRVSTLVRLFWSIPGHVKNFVFPLHQYINLSHCFQVFNEINSRDMEKINVIKGILGNWVFLAILSSTVMFQVIIVEFLGTFADTVPLNLRLWLLSIGIGAVSLLIAVLLKGIPVDNLRSPAKTHDGYEELPSGPELA